MANPHGAALDTLAAWQDYRGTTPFGGSNGRFAHDRCARFLSEAGCILSLLSAAHQDSESLLRTGSHSVFDERTGMSGALEGIGTLIDLASFMLEDGK